MGEPYENTIHGLLKKRRDLLGETDKLRKALTATLEDTRALDRTLRALGHKGDLKRMTPAGTRTVVFHRDELRRYLLDTLRKAEGPLDARELSERTMRKEGQDPADRDLRNRMSKRVGQCLRLLRKQGLASSAYDAHGYFVWEIVRKSVDKQL